MQGVQPFGDVERDSLVHVRVDRVSFCIGVSGCAHRHAFLDARLHHVGSETVPTVVEVEVLDACQEDRTR
jgi:hypothetical protein